MVASARQPALPPALAAAAGRQRPLTWWIWYIALPVVAIALVLLSTLGLWTGIAPADPAAVIGARVNTLLDSDVERIAAGRNLGRIDPLHDVLRVEVPVANTTTARWRLEHVASSGNCIAVELPEERIDAGDVAMVTLVIDWRGRSGGQSEHVRLRDTQGGALINLRVSGDIRPWIDLDPNSLNIRAHAGQTVEHRVTVVTPIDWTRWDRWSDPASGEELSTPEPVELPDFIGATLERRERVTLEAGDARGHVFHLRITVPPAPTAATVRFRDPRVPGREAELTLRLLPYHPPAAAPPDVADGELPSVEQFLAALHARERSFDNFGYRATGITRRADRLGLNQVESTRRIRYLDGRYRVEERSVHRLVRTVADDEGNVTEHVETRIYDAITGWDGSERRVLYRTLRAEEFEAANARGADGGGGDGGRVGTGGEGRFEDGGESTNPVSSTYRHSAGGIQQSVFADDLVMRVLCKRGGRTGLAGWTVPMTLGQHLELEAATYGAHVEAHDIDGRTLPELVIPGPSPAEQRRLIVDPQRGWMPVEHRHVRSDGRLVQAWRVTESEQMSGLWVPVTIVLGGGTSQPAWETRVQVEAWAIDNVGPADVRVGSPEEEQAPEAGGSLPVRPSRTHDPHVGDVMLYR